MTSVYESIRNKRDEFAKELEEKGLISRERYTEAFITMHSTSSKKDSFSVCSLSVKGIGQEDVDIVTVNVFLDDELVKTADLPPVIPGQQKTYTVTVPEDAVKDRSGRNVHCAVVVVDKYYRSLAQSVGDIVFSAEELKVECSAETRFVNRIDCDDDDTRPALGEVRIKTDKDAQFGIEIFDSDALLWQDSVHVTGGSDYRYMMSAESCLFDGKDKVKLRTVVRFNGKVVSENDAEIQVQHKKPSETKEVKEKIPHVEGELVVPEYLDVQDADASGMINIGDILVINKEKKPCKVKVVLTNNGTDVLRRTYPIDGKKSIPLSMSFANLAKEEQYPLELMFEIYDEYGRKLFSVPTTIIVRSKYDLDLHQLKSRSLIYVNPREESISSLIHDVDGPLAKAMKGKYSIEGYQLGCSNVRRQMEAVFDMIRDMEFRYVDDSFVINRVSLVRGDDGKKSYHAYQRVKSPAVTLKSHNGNCIELSYMFASFYEAMGLHPVIIITKTHAMAGVEVPPIPEGSKVDDSYRTLVNKFSFEYKEDGKSYFIVPLESTLCAYKVSFESACNSALDTVREKMSSKDDYVECYLISDLRKTANIKPIMGL